MLSVSITVLSSEENVTLVFYIVHVHLHCFGRLTTSHLYFYLVQPVHVASMKKVSLFSSEHTYTQNVRFGVQSSNNAESHRGLSESILV